MVSRCEDVHSWRVRKVRKQTYDPLAISWTVAANSRATDEFQWTRTARTRTRTHVHFGPHATSIVHKFVAVGEHIFYLFLFELNTWLGYMVSLIRPFFPFLHDRMQYKRTHAELAWYTAPIREVASDLAASVRKIMTITSSLPHDADLSWVRIFATRQQHIFAKSLRNGNIHAKVREKGYVCVCVCIYIYIYILH